ncbi:hypothetical protein [uncultured Parolsenella sp.]|uniref:hypothetical protein n=1 Tax=uncultured Parolsenella sp. TaxID=2083008 RepID=UPI0025FDAFE8|nr:hypothetical protein [uncultured Parolsenella sp.]
MEYTDIVRKDVKEIILATVKEANRIMVQEGDGSDSLTSGQVYHLRRVVRMAENALDLLD